MVAEARLPELLQRVRALEQRLERLAARLGEARCRGATWLSRRSIRPRSSIRTPALGARVRIGAYTVVGPEVVLGDDVEVGHHVVLEGRVDARRAACGSVTAACWAACPRT